MNKRLAFRSALRARRVPFLVMGAFTLCAMGWFLPWADRVAFKYGATLVSAEISEEASYQRGVRVRLQLQAEGPLPEDVVAVVQCNADAVTCNGVGHAPFKTAPTRWQAGRIYAQEITLQVPESCGLGELTLYAGLYNLRTQALLPVLEPLAENDRVLIGTSELVAEGARENLRKRDAAAIARSTLLAPVVPWRGWLFGMAAVWLLVLVSRPAESGGTAGQPREPMRFVRTGLFGALPILVFIVGMGMVLEFLKDDAYISFRYARNLVRGAGLVFNPGERVEGITNLLWTLWLVPFEALGWDLFRVCQFSGAAFSIACLVVVTRLAGFTQENDRVGSETWPALWLASSSSFVLYAGSGLEQSLAALLPCAGAYTLYQSREARRQATAARRSERGYLLAGLTLGAACLTRPELHLCALLVPMPVWIDVVRARRMDRSAWLLVAGILLVTAPAHLARYLYYGELLPNTFYVKTSSDLGIARLGLDTARDLFAFNHTGLLLVLMPAALLQRRHFLEKCACVTIGYAFLAYYIRVGVDEMVWHRLYIPALPFICVAAACGVQNLITLLSTRVFPGLRPWLIGGLAWIALVAWMLDDLQLTYRAFNGFNGYGALSGAIQADLGKFLTRHERADGLVAFQDMGATPYYAPDLRFLDFVGLVDSRVAQSRHRHGLHAFVENTTPAQAAFDREMRSYFFARDPAWTVLTVHADETIREPLERAFRADPTGAALSPFMAKNPLQFGLWNDERFREGYVAVRCYRRSSDYYLVVFRRRDLWQRPPREVLLDAPPMDMRGVRAVFSGGLALLGTQLPTSARERQELLVSSWWRLPGPRAPDLTFFVELEREGRARFLSEHVPGDFMYPADRWRAGEILADRTLLQLPPNGLSRGKYRAYLGVYPRATRAPLPVEAGGEAGLLRVLLGTVQIEALLPLFQPLIAPTEVSSLRAYPQRIADSQSTR